MSGRRPLLAPVHGRPECCGPGGPLRLVPDVLDSEAGDRAGAAAQYADARTRAQHRGRLPGDPGVNIGRPRPIFRGEGAERERQWGAVVDLPAAPGDRVQLVAKSGRTWTATVAEPLGAVSGGHLVALAGAEWQPAPDTPPADPDWMHD